MNVLRSVFNGIVFVITVLFMLCVFVIALPFGIIKAICKVILGLCVLLIELAREIAEAVLL